jgi:hypothetical protein
MGIAFNDDLEDFAGEMRKCARVARSYRDPEQTAVRIEIATVDGGTIFAQCVVLHRGTEVVDVRLPDGHGALASAAGISWEAAAEWEGYLCILARFAFARGGR